MRVCTERTVLKSKFQSRVALARTQWLWHWLFVAAVTKILSKHSKLFRILLVTKSWTIQWYQMDVKKNEVSVIRMIVWRHCKNSLDSSKEEKRETQISFCKKCSQPIFGNPIRTSKLEEFEYCTMSCLKVTTSTINNNLILSIVRLTPPFVKRCPKMLWNWAIQQCWKRKPR